MDIHTMCDEAQESALLLFGCCKCEGAVGAKEKLKLRGI